MQYCGLCQVASLAFYIKKAKKIDYTMNQVLNRFRHIADMRKKFH